MGRYCFFNGRKEFGGKHQKFVSYALICIAVVILFSIITAFANSFIFSAFAIDDSSLISISTIIIFPIIISAFFGSLVYVFALYHLEDDIGQKLLYIAFIVSILVSIYSLYISRQY